MKVIDTLQRVAWMSAAGFSSTSSATLGEVHASFEKVAFSHCLNLQTPRGIVFSATLFHSFSLLVAYFEFFSFVLS